ncbi:MAG: hypothetical protein ABIZ04_23075 [Opitutus sp.]
MTPFPRIVRSSARGTLATLVLLCAVLGYTRLSASETATAASGVTALREAFRYAPSVPIETALVPTDEPVIVLENLTITESMSRRALARQIEDRWASERREAFTWTKGGHIGTHEFGKFQADTGAWVTLGDRTTGINPTRELFIKVEILRLRW